MSRSAGVFLPMNRWRSAELQFCAKGFVRAELELRAPGSWSRLEFLGTLRLSLNLIGGASGPASRGGTLTPAREYARPTQRFMGSFLLHFDMPCAHEPEMHKLLDIKQRVWWFMGRLVGRARVRAGSRVRSPHTAVHGESPWFFEHSLRP